MSYVQNLEVVDQERIRKVCQTQPQKVLDIVAMLATMEADLKDQLATIPLGTPEGVIAASTIQGRIFGLGVSFNLLLDNLLKDDSNDNSN